MAREAIVGEFKKIDFSKREITIRYATTGRNLSCFYEDNVEASLLEHPRERLLVFGSVTRHEKGLPNSIEDVDHIEPVDLQDIDVKTIALEDRTIVPIESLAASVTFDERDVVYLAGIEPLGISVFGETREGLIAALTDEIAVLWSRYACEQDENLTPAARALKRNIKDAFREQPNAAKTP